MGWLYGWSERRGLVDHILKDARFKAHAFRGNNMWTVFEFEPSKHCIILFMLQRSGGEWGYKDMDEGMGPYTINCPLSLLKMVEDTPPLNEWSRAWREKVREYHALRSRKLEVDSHIRLYGKEYIVSAILKGGIVRVVSMNGTHYKLKRSQIAEVTIL